MSTLPHTSPLSLRAQAYESFQQQIVDANIRPGQFISQRELMQLLGMPLGAVRELIPRLEAEGLLKTVPQRGLQVAHVDLKLINNAFQLRQLLEREAASRFVTTVSDRDLAAIEQLEEALDSYTGTLLLVTHDRRMLENVTLDRHWHVENGTVTEQ